MRHFSRRHQLETPTTPHRESFLLAFNTQKFNDDSLLIKNITSGFLPVIISVAVEAVASTLSKNSTIIQRPEGLTEKDCQEIFYNVLLDENREYRIIQVHCDSTDGSLVFFINRCRESLIIARFPHNLFYLIPRSILQLNSLATSEIVHLQFRDSTVPLYIEYRNPSTIERYTLNHHRQDDNHATWHLAEIETTI